MSMHGPQNLWMEVLHTAVDDAVNGVRAVGANTEDRIRKTVKARRYLTVPNDDFDMVCLLAGLDPEAVRERIKATLAEAPTPNELFKGAKVSKGTKPITFKGVTDSISGWSRRLGVDQSTLSTRLKKGWPLERALTPARPKRTPMKTKAMNAAIGSGLCADLSQLRETGV